MTTFSKMAKNNRGFSLVELMVVVAIIGVLAAIAIPNVTKYIAKARQSEAKTQLSSIFTSEKAFYAEYSAYHSMFGAIGYSPEGKLRYASGFSAATGFEAGPTNGYSTVPVGVGADRDSVNYCGIAIAMTDGCMMLSGADNVAAALPAGTYTIYSAYQFLAGAGAVVYIPGGGAVVKDIWTITQDKDLENPTPGIN